MDEEKKSESSWEDAERLGPYQLREQVAQAEQGRGELYRATHETSGTTALVYKPTTEEGSEPLEDWRVRCISSASPGYLALEVEHTPWSVAPDKHSVEALVCMFEDVCKGVRRMARALPVDDVPRRWWRLGLALAGTAAVFALVFTLVRLAPVSQPPGDPEPLARAAPAPVSDEVPTDTAMPLMGNWVLMGSSDGGSAVLAVPLPNKPYKGQRRPPCKPRVEVEINGGCWMPHELKAPCPEDLYEYQGKCYSVSGQVPRQPQSLEP